MKRLIYILIITCLTINSLFAQPEILFDGFSISPFSSLLKSFEYDGQFGFHFRDNDTRGIWITDGNTVKNLTIWLNDNDFDLPTPVGKDLYFVDGLGIFQGTNLWKYDGNVSQKIVDNIPIAHMFSIQDKLVFSTTGGLSLPNLYSMINNTQTLLVSNVGLSTESAVFNDELYLFSSNHGIIKTDGTIAGTTIVKPIDNTNFNNATFRNATVFNNELYFRACDNSNGCQVWKTNGTDVGTVFVGSIAPFQNNLYGDKAGRYVVANNKLYIHTKYRLYCLENQTLNLVLNFEWPGYKGQFYEGKAINDKAIFVINTYEQKGTELWISDGTTVGTTILKDINQSAADGVINAQGLLNQVGNYLYFIGNDGEFGREFWRTDGTTDGTELVYDLNPKIPSSHFYKIYPLDTTLFIFRKPTTGSLSERRYSLWKFDVSNFEPQQVNRRSSIDNFYSMYAGHNNLLTDFIKDKNDTSYIAITDKFPFHNDIVLFNEDTTINRENTSKQTTALIKLSPNYEFENVTSIYSGIDFSDQQIRLAIDSNNDLYVTGQYYDDLKIGNTTINVADFGLYFSKFKKNGALNWSIIGKTPGGIQTADWFINSKDEIIYVCLFNTLEINGETHTGNNSIGLLKMDTTGNILSFHSFGNHYHSIKATITADDVIIVSTTQGSNIYLHKINPSNELVWSKSFADHEGESFIHQVAVSPTDDIYLLGDYYGKLQFDNYSVNYYGDAFNRNGFLAKFNTFGAATMLKADETTTSFYTNMAFANDSYYIIKKEYNKEEPFFHENGENLPSSSKSVIQKINSNEQIVGERILLNTSLNYYYPNTGLSINENDDITYVDMYYNQLDTFINCIPESEMIDKIVFLLEFSMLDFPKTVIPVPPTTEPTNLTVSPNPASKICHVYIYDEQWKNYQLNIYSSTGKLVKSIYKTDESDIQSISVSDLPTGLFFFEFNNGNEKITEKVIKF